MATLKERIRRAMYLKTLIGNLINKKRILTCGHAKTLRCTSCNAISIDRKYLQYWFCSERYCPLCMILKSQEKSRFLSELLIEVLQDQAKNEVMLLPVNIVFTIPHKPEDNLKDLLDIFIKAWKYMRCADNSSRRVMHYKKGTKSFWREHFLGEAWSLEMPHNKSGWHVHQHVLALRHFDKIVEIGTDPKTGEIINSNGLRPQWHLCVKKAWQEQHETGNIRPYAEHYKVIERKTKQRILKEKIVIPPYVHINSLYYQKGKRKVPITWLLKKENILSLTPISLE